MGGDGDRDRIKHLGRKAVLSLGDYKNDNDYDKVVVIPCHEVREIENHSKFHWGTEINHQDGRIEIHSECCRQIKVGKDLKHREILLVEMLLMETSTMLAAATISAMKNQDRLDEEREEFVQESNSQNAAISMMRNT